jgi:hypothetical protein
MPSEFVKLPDDLDLDPAEIFRPRQAFRYFGLGHSQVAEKVKSGELPAPIPLSANGTAVGWTGRQLILHHRRRLQLAAAKNSNNKDAA